jgi:hypothetical protein
VFPNIKWLRLTPDRPGRGGWNTGNHSFQQTPINDVRILKSAHIYRGSWRRDYDPIEYPGEIVQRGSLACLAIHGYTYPSLTDPAAAPTIKILEQNNIINWSTVYSATDGTTRQQRPPTSQPGIFVNIGGRCVFGDGGTEALLMDDRTPAIHAQQNQKLGISTPVQPLSDASPAGPRPEGTGYLYNGGHYIAHPDPNNMLRTVLATDTLTFSVPNTSYGQYAGAVIASGSPTTDAETSNTTTFSAPGTISITTGTSLVTLGGGAFTWPAGFAYCGMAINFNGYSL